MRETRPYWEIIRDYLNRYTPPTGGEDHRTAIDMETGEILDAPALERLREMAAGFAYESTATRHRWRGECRVVARLSMTGGVWEKVVEVYPAEPFVPALAFYCPRHTW